MVRELATLASVLALTLAACSWNVGGVGSGSGAQPVDDGLEDDGEGPATAGVRLYYRAFHRSETEGNDPTWVELRFLGSGGNELAVYPSGQYSGITWNESVGNFLAPAGTHYVQLSLQRNRVLNEWCSGFFDGMEVWAEWLG